MTFTLTYAIQAILGSIVGAGIVYILYPKFDTFFRRIGYAAVACFLALLTAKSIINFLNTKLGVFLDIDHLGVLIVTIAYQAALPPITAFVTSKSNLREHLSNKPLP
jgi:hypothetical protein